MTLKAQADQHSTLTSFCSKGDGVGPIHTPRLRRASHSMSLTISPMVLSDSAATSEIYSSTIALSPVPGDSGLLSAFSLRSQTWSVALDDEDDEEEDEDLDDEDLDADDEDLDEEDDEDLEDDDDFDEDGEDEDEDGYDDDDDDEDDEDEDEEE